MAILRTEATLGILEDVNLDSLAEIVMADFECCRQKLRQLLIGEFLCLRIPREQARPIRERAHLAEELRGLTTEVGEQRGLHGVQPSGDPSLIKPLRGLDYERTSFEFHPPPCWRTT